MGISQSRSIWQSTPESLAFFDDLVGIEWLFREAVEVPVLSLDQMANPRMRTLPVVVHPLPRCFARVPDDDEIVAALGLKL